MTARTARETLLISGVMLVLIIGTVVAQQRVAPDRHVPLDLVGYALLTALGGVLVARHRWPRVVFGVVVGMVALYLASGYAYGPVFLAASVAAFAFALAAQVWVVVGGVAGAVVLWLAVELRSGTGADDLVPLVAGFAGCLVVPVWLAAMSIRARDRAAVDGERRRREQGEQRLELAREVHDVVAHNLTVIGLQTGAALTVLDRDPERARECLSLIAQTNRQALSELRGTIDLLRDPRTAGSERTPVGDGRPDISALVESARAAGTPVELTVRGGRRPSVAVERVAHRIVQESLTNAMRHACGSAVRVELVDDGDHLRVRVSDDGPGLDGRPPGRGIGGMRERAESVGGSLVIGAGESGGTVVRADLPLGGLDR